MRTAMTTFVGSLSDTASGARTLQIASKCAATHGQAGTVSTSLTN